jgi:hypothetical protein
VSIFREGPSALKYYISWLAIAAFRKYISTGK